MVCHVAVYGGGICMEVGTTSRVISQSYAQYSMLRILNLSLSTGGGVGVSEEDQKVKVKVKVKVKEKV